MRYAVKLLLLFVALSYSIAVFATAQRGDVLVFEGNRYSIQSNPLEEFLEKNPGKLPKSRIVSTSLWRGYVATWEIKNDRLMLTDVAILQSVTKPSEKDPSTDLVSVMSKMFPDQKEVPADWFTGHLIIPEGKMVNYVHMGYASTFENYIILRIESGKVTRKLNENTAGFQKFSKAQFAAFKKTDEYRRALEETKKDGGSMGERDIEEFLRQYYSGRYLSMVFD